MFGPKGLSFPRRGNNASGPKSRGSEIAGPETDTDVRLDRRGS
jgi:hypothetical protein